MSPRRVADGGPHERIQAVVLRIPRGRVATYGQVAALAGLPGHARQVGWALHALRDDSPVPWQRVVNARGEISRRSEPGGAEIQQQLLESEGVAFERDGRIDLRRFLWRPLPAASRRSRLHSSPPAITDGGPPPTSRRGRSRRGASR